MIDFPQINSAESMVRTIRMFGIIPFFKNRIPGWSIEELTAPEYWFFSSDELGPWDWKIEAVRQGDIAYGKYIRNKAAFSTVEWYAHLMNWRRSLQQYRIPLDEKYSGNTLMDRLYKVLSPTLLNIIREKGAVEPSEMRQLLQERSKEEQLMSIGGSMNKYLFPKIKRTAVDFLNIYLEMGTWTVIGDFQRICRGPDKEYTGWQRSSITTPEMLFTSNYKKIDNEPFWVRMISEDKHSYSPTLLVDCSPEESLDLLLNHIQELTGCHDKQLIRVALG